MIEDPGPGIKASGCQKTFKQILDPLRALTMFSDEEVILLESADHLSRTGERSVLFFDLALRIEARGGVISITALLDEARPLISQLAERFSHVSSRSDDSITITTKPLYHQVDLLEKMHARSALDVLRAVTKSIDVDGDGLKEFLMLVGVFSYDFLDHFEKLPTAHLDVHGFPDFLFYLPMTTVVFEHKSLNTVISCFALGDGESIASRMKVAEGVIGRMADASFDISVGSGADADRRVTFDVDIPDDEFCSLIDRCKQHINRGDVYQIVPSRTFSKPIRDPIGCYGALRSINPSPYMFYVKTRDWTLFGASPETFIKVDDGGTRVSVRPIAGTRRRGFLADGSIDIELDSREQASLCLDEKELAEHMMLVDLARNDVASVARPRTRHVKRLLGVDRFSHVMHLVSEVEGRLRQGFDALSAYQASMNMGTLMGAPKVMAAILLRRMERSKRGFYGGAMGYIDLLGNMDTAIIIRSALVQDGRGYVRAGCGVVYDSESRFEAQETINKAEAVLRAMDWRSDGHRHP